MNGRNPYNCSAPGNLFVGYKRLRQELMNGFRNSRSYAILGGRRCGKTSLLLQLAKDLQNEGLAPLTPIPRLLDIQSLGRYSPKVLFEQIYALVVQEVGASPFLPRDEGQEYQDFLAALDKAKPLLDQRYGVDWVVILLIDELDTAIEKLPTDQFFQNLRNLLMMSRFHRHFRLVASGVTGMAKLISSGSPLNNLRNIYLGILTDEQAQQLVLKGFPDGLDPELELELFQLTGRHPYLWQGLLEKLWDAQPDIDQHTQQKASREFLREHYDFDHWLESFGPAEHAVYRLLSSAPNGALQVQEIRRQIEQDLASQVDNALTILSYHGVIDDSDPAEPQIAGTMFRDWYRNNAPRQAQPKVTTEPQQPRAIRVFISYSHKDDTLRSELDEHLSILKSQGFLDVWHDRQITAGKEWEGAIDSNLEAADMILLLVSSSFVASPYCRDKELKRALEKHKEGSAQVIPIIVRPVDWSGASFSKLQMLPKDGKAVMSSAWQNRDEAWVDVAGGIRRAVEELRKR